MAGKSTTVSHELEGATVYQRASDGYVNATQICSVHKEVTGERKDPNDWLRTKMASSAISKLSAVTGIPVTGLFEVKKGGKYQGTWIHPRLAVRFTMWVNDDFSLAVEDWVHSYIESSSPAQLEADLDRVAMRDELKDAKRTALTSQIKTFLEKAGSYDPKTKETSMFFGRVHNEVNIVLTGEKAVDMRLRLKEHIGKEVTEKELLRDYFPITDLANYAAICQAAANNMENGMHPINAVNLAARQVLPSNYQPKPINFTERVALVRQRLAKAKDNLPLL
jgi:hypothetical protein